MGNFFDSSTTSVPSGGSGMNPTENTLRGAKLQRSERSQSTPLPRVLPDSGTRDKRCNIERRSRTRTWDGASRAVSGPAIDGGIARRKRDGNAGDWGHGGEHNDTGGGSSTTCDSRGGGSSNGKGSSCSRRNSSSSPDSCKENRGTVATSRHTSSGKGESAKVGSGAHHKAEPSVSRGAKLSEAKGDSFAFTGPAKKRCKHDAGRTSHASSLPLVRPQVRNIKVYDCTGDDGQAAQVSHAGVRRYQQQ